jgi:hypothetical protein
MRFSVFRLTPPHMIPLPNKAEISAAGTPRDQSLPVVIHSVAWFILTCVYDSVNSKPASSRLEHVYPWEQRRMGIERFTRKGVALRKSPRARMNHTVRLQFDDGSLASCGTLSDLSETGARVVASGGRQAAGKVCPDLPPDLRLMWQSNEDVEFLAAGAGAAAPAAPQPQPAPQERPRQGLPRAAGPAKAAGSARSGSPGSPGGSLPLWDYSDNHRPKRR